MGLDMYGMTLSNTPPSAVDFAADDAAHIHYWRKHPNLHGWMERLYREKGGADPQFNCACLLLERKDIDRLEADINAGNLPSTTGFFFGETDGSEAEDDLQFCQKARTAIEAGLSVVYSSWW